MASEAVRLDLTPSGRGVLAELDARLEGDSMLRGSVGMDDINQPNDATVNGDLRLNLPDIGVFNRLVAELDNLGGRLEGDLAIRGRLNAPQLDGQARLVKGTVVHAPLGLNIENIELTLEGSNAESTLTGRMVSGDGHLNINGSLRPDGNRWVWSLAAEGEQFSFADVTWLQIQASPRISLDGRGERMTIDGDIGIDHLARGHAARHRGQGHDVRGCRRAGRNRAGRRQLRSQAEWTPRHRPGQRRPPGCGRIANLTGGRC